jgi:PAS domain S-box-containing protein
VIGRQLQVFALKGPESIDMSKKPSYEELEQRIRELEEKISPTHIDVALRESRELFEKIFLSQRDAIFILNADIPPVIIDCNPAAERIFGYARQEMQGRAIEFLHVNRATLEEFQKQLYTSIAKQGFFRLNDFMMKRKDETLFPSEHTVVPLNYEKAERTGWVSAVRDITGRKQMQNALRESEERYRLLAENVSDVIWIRDMNLQLTYISPSVEKLTGYSVQEAMALTLQQSYTPDSITTALKVFGEELSREKGEQGDPSRVRTIEMEGFRKDGSRIWTEAKMSFLRDSTGQLAGVLGVSRDITDRKRAEQALRENEERYRQLFNHAPAGIYEVDFIKQKFVAVNDVMCEYTGYTREEFLSMNPGDILSEEARAIYYERARKLLIGEQVPAAIEYRIRAKAGREFWVFLNTRPAYENGRVKGATAVVHDITERRKTEDALKRSEERLRSLSSELIKGQENYRAQVARELHDELGQSLALLKHRVRSIKKRVPENESSLQRNCDEAIDSVDEIISQIRRLSKELSPSILKDIGISPALRWLGQNFTEQYSIPISIDIDEISGLFSKEAQMSLYRISQEALTNIGKHAEASHVTFTVKKKMGSIAFVIEDDGKGFDTAGLKGEERWRKGLGLNLIEERVHFLRASFDVQSLVGKGTRILLTIPIESEGVK